MKTIYDKIIEDLRGMCTELRVRIEDNTEVRKSIEAETGLPSEIHMLEEEELLDVVWFLCDAMVKISRRTKTDIKNATI
jgi:hypothetical protein